MGRLVIAAPQSGAGKTTICLGLLAALSRRGVRVQPFKAGPDFIDPGLHQLAAGVVSHNLDTWMLSREENLALFLAHTNGKDLAVVEGAMGLFDGREGNVGTIPQGSTAELALWLDAPTALLEISRMVREEGLRPALVIGVPVGFVNAAESKEALLGLPVPAIVTRGRVFAVEKNAADAAIIRQNIEKFSVDNVTVIEGRAPEALSRIVDDPEAVFIGGSGGEMAEVIQVSLARLHDGGRIVVNAITIDNLAAATQACKDSGYPFEVTLLQVARSKLILDLIRFAALNPIFIVSLVKDRMLQQPETQEDI